MSRLQYLFIGLILTEILLLFIGCHSQKDNPLFPDLVPSTEQTEPGNEQLLTPGGTIREIANIPALWGLYEVAYIPATHSFEVVPLRGPAFAFNVVVFLQPPMGKYTCLGLTLLDDSQFQETGRLDFRVLLNHPFPGQPFYNGFDVMCVFMTESSITAPYDPCITYADPSVDPHLLNPDGYTRWMNPTEFLSGNIFGYEPGFWGTSESSENSGFLAGATLNPYKYYAFGLPPDKSLYDWASEPGTLEGRGMFPSGSSAARDFQVVFPTVENKLNFKFNYAFVANWLPPTNNPPIDPLEDFPISANAEYSIPLMVTDLSKAYYTPEESGGYLEFEIDILDWRAFNGTSSVENEVSRFITWSDSALIPGGWAETMSDEVEWNSGFTAGISTAHIKIGNVTPEFDGTDFVWIGIENAAPSSYDQGMGVIVPGDPVCSYIRVPVSIANCPQAVLGSMSANSAVQGTQLNAVEISGDNFIDGQSLDVWLELEENVGESADPPISVLIYATNVEYVDSETLLADFDLTSAPMGYYDIGCVNGCGAVTAPDFVHTMIGASTFAIIPNAPEGIKLNTGRITQEPLPVTGLNIKWDPVPEAEYYNIYVNAYTINGNQIFGSIGGNTSNTEIQLNFSNLAGFQSGRLVIFVKSAVNVGGSVVESALAEPSYLFYQDFETGLGAWNYREENGVILRFVRSVVSASAFGTWGTKSLGYIPSGPTIWATLVSPPLEFSSITEPIIKFEMLHRNQLVQDDNGYVVAWSQVIPTNGSPILANTTILPSVSYGYGYNDDKSKAIRDEFALPSYDVNNFRNGNVWSTTTPGGWVMSGFDATSTIPINPDSRLMVAFAGESDSVFDINIDEVAILVY